MYIFSDPNYWATAAGYYGNYSYGQDPSQYFAAAATAAAYGAWGADGTWTVAPSFQPPPPSQPPPPPPPEEDVPPPPPGAPSDSAQPSPKRAKTSSDHTEALPTDLPPPPPGSIPKLSTTAKTSAKPKDKCGYYDSSTDTTSWDTSTAWSSGATVTRTFAQVVSGKQSETSDDRTGNDPKINYQNLIYPNLAHVKISPIPQFTTHSLLGNIFKYDQLVHIRCKDRFTYYVSIIGEGYEILPII